MRVGEDEGADAPTNRKKKRAAGTWPTTRLTSLKVVQIDLAINIFITSFEPPKMRVMRASRYIFAIGYSLM